MRAAIVERPGALVVRDVPEPPIGDYDALCALLYGATCSGTDLHIAHGRFPWPVQYPTVLGHESIGRVVRVGPKVRYLRPGDLVTRVGAPGVGDVSATWGGFAEMGVARDHRAMREDGRPREEWIGFRINQRLPDGVDAAAATMVITWRETLSYLTRMGLGGGRSLLVVGSGGNGLAFAAHAHNLGAARVVMLGSPRRESAARAVGVAVFADYRAADSIQRAQAACPAGYDFVIDAVGKQGALDSVLPCARDGGAVGIYGVDDWGACAIRPQRARGAFTYASGAYDEEETHERVVAFIREGKLDASVWLDLAHPYPLEEIGRALEAVERRDCVKALVRLSADPAGW